MKFEILSRLAWFLSKEYAIEFLRLLQVYPSLSASESAARLSIHIKTAQDFLEGLENAGILGRKEIVEKKRPYFRYFLRQDRIKIDCDLKDLIDNKNRVELLNRKVKENKNAPAHFASSSKSKRLSSVSLILGEGRSRKERKISLTENQGRFLFFLPFPTEPPLGVRAVLKKADIEEQNIDEVLDIVEVLRDHKVINVV